MTEKVGKGHPPKHSQWQPGQSGNPAGKPKGTKHLSTHIQELLNDEEFEFMVLDGDDKGKVISYKGAPIKAIIGTAIIKSIKGDQRWAEWLARHGYGTKINVNTGDPVEEVLKMFGLIEPEGDTDDAEQAEDITS